MSESSQHRDRLVDLAGPLLPQLERNLALPVAEQIAAWQSYYEEHAPELPPRLYADYRSMEGRWRKVAEERVFPTFGDLMGRMTSALGTIRAVHEELCQRAANELGFGELPIIVVYVGLGNAAGWATTWQGKPAVLLGLENIADLGWHSEETLRGLIAHEMGHLLMAEVRRDQDFPADDPLFALYEEGFAQHCEHVVAGRETWHCQSQDGWLPWCRDHEANLAKQFLDAMDDREAWRRFFGSWFDIDGWRQTGYYLGCRFVQKQARRESLRNMAARPLKGIRSAVLTFLEELAATDI